jgi:hypothetical protein
MKTTDLLLIGGLGLVAYYLFKKPKQEIIDINPAMDSAPKPAADVQNPTSTVVDISKRKMTGLFDSAMYASYNTSKNATVSPAAAQIFPNFF